MKWLIERLAQRKPHVNSNPCKISRLDWWVYRLFYRRWSRIFEQRPDMARTFSEHLTEWINAADAERLNEANKAAKSTHESTAPAKVIKFPRKRPNLTLVTQANVSKSEKQPESD